MSELEIVVCGPQDRGMQARLFNACFRKRVEAGDLGWRYDRNPHGAAVSLVGRPEGAREPVTGYACSPRRAVPAGDEAAAALVGETGDVMTHPDWRKRGLFSRLDRACMSEVARRGWPLAFGLPNHRSAHIFLELGWERVGSCRPWSLVLRPGPAARAERRREGRWKAWTTSLSARRAGAARRRLERGAADLEVRPLAAFPAEVEELSRAVEPRFAFMVRRDAAYLDWRFVRSPSGLHRPLGLFERGGAHLRGYAVVQVPRPGEPAGWLVDLLAADDAAVARALAAGLDELERSGAALARATAIEGSWWEARLRAAGFEPGPERSTMMVILCPHRPEHALVAAARRAAGWYFTDGDRDDETMG